MIKKSKPISKTITLALGSISLIGLSGCQASMQEFRQSLSNIEMPSVGLPSMRKDNKDQSGNAEIAKTGKNNAQKQAVSMDGITKCPSVTIVGDLESISEFTDMGRPSEETLVSEATMNVGKTSCVYSPQNNSVAVQVTVNIDSELGPRSKIYKGDQPNFAYPYFIAVTDPGDNIIAKEVFAASIAYESEDEELTHEETLRQIIPLEDIARGPDYDVLIGFQLTESQLAYNRLERMEKDMMAEKQSAAGESWIPRDESAEETQSAPAPRIVPVNDVEPASGGSGGSSARASNDLTEPFN